MADFSCHRCGEKLSGDRDELVRRIQLHYSWRHDRFIPRRKARRRLDEGVSEPLVADRV